MSRETHGPGAALPGHLADRPVAPVTVTSHTPPGEVTVNPAKKSTTSRTVLVSAWLYGSTSAAGLTAFSVASTAAGSRTNPVPAGSPLVSTMASPYIDGTPSVGFMAYPTPGDDTTAA